MGRTNKINILIVDDNPEELDYCADIIRSMYSQVNIFTSFNGREAMECLREVSIDLAFLDVYLPGESGFQLAERIRSLNQYKLLSIIFVTADVKNELDAFRRFHCYYYVTKPFTKESFISVVKPLIYAIAEGSQVVQCRRKMIPVRTVKGDYLIRFSDIIFVEKLGRQLMVHTKTGVMVENHSSLASFIHRVNEPSFIQCHKSFAANIDEAISVNPLFRRNWSLSFRDSSESCPVSSTYYENVRMILGKDEREL